MSASLFPRNPIHRRDLLALVLILLVAGVLRLGRPDVLHFQYDQAELSSLAQDVASGRAFPLLGQTSSAGLPNAPMAHYILALPFALFKNPQPVTLTVAVWNMIGVGLLWLLAHRYIDPRVAVVAGVLFAMNPAAVEFSRKIWVQNVHTPFILLGLLTGLYGFVEGKKWAQVVSFPVWLIGLQTHYAAWVLLPLAIWPIWVGRRQIDWPANVNWRTNVDWRAVGIGLLLGALVLLPFAVGVLQLVSQDAGVVGDSLGSGPLRLRGKVFYRVLPLFTGGLNVEVERGLVDPGVLLETPLDLAIGVFLAGCTLLGLVAVWLRPAWRTWAVPLLLWVLLPVFAFWPNWTGVYTHYFVPVIPGICLAGGLGAVWLVTRVPARGRQIAWAVLGVILAAVLVIQGMGYFAQLERNSTTVHSKMGIPLRMSLAVRDVLAPYEDVLIVGADSTRSGHVVWDALLYYTAEHVREVVAADGGIAVLPGGPFAVLTAPLADPLALYETGDPLTVPLREDEGSYRIDFFEAAPAWNGPDLTPVPPTRFANGLTLTGYALADDHLYVEWLLPDANPDGGYLRYFGHLLDANGDRIAQRDGDFWPGGYWQAGDRLILWIPLTTPTETQVTEAITLRLGLYRVVGDGLRGVDVIDKAGNAVAPWLDVPLD